MTIALSRISHIELCYSRILMHLLLVPGRGGELSTGKPELAMSNMYRTEDDGMNGTEWNGMEQNRT
jgi:hypothetical protein